MIDATPISPHVLIGELDRHLFAEGRHHELYRMLGAHPMHYDGESGVRFAVWAPNAGRVSVVGSFNGWDSSANPMQFDAGTGLHLTFVPGVAKGDLYKFAIFDQRGCALGLKADPVALRAQHPPETASVVHGLVDYDWGDDAWMTSRHQSDPIQQAMSVYEVHLGSWARVPEDDDRYLSYSELADRLIPYALQMGFTHLELMPVAEYPFDGSWGYQPTGLFAPTIRHGSAEEFAGFIDRCHQAGLGVLMDWVPAHFPADAHGLARFDGTALYEHEDPRQGYHQDWKTLIYNYGRREVRNFLVANALYWLDCFHIDGLRVDAVASMLYLDYSREPGQWVANEQGGRENLDAVAFLRELNTLTHAKFPGTVMIAEESTAWPGVSAPVESGGLGFTFKWNMGWMHDTLGYFSRDALYRKYHQSELTFGLVYAFTENFVLPISHDEVVHGKGSMIAKMPGDDWQQRAGLRALYAVMWSHPGKKLLFMGNEFAQRREWAYAQSLDWHLLDNAAHLGIQQMIAELNRLYRREAALHQRDHAQEGFSWIDYQDTENCVLAWSRHGPSNAPDIVIVVNLIANPHRQYRIGLPDAGRWTVMFDSDAVQWGGSGFARIEAYESQPIAWHGHSNSVELTLPPMAVLMLRKS